MCGLIMGWHRLVRDLISHGFQNLGFRYLFALCLIEIKHRGILRSWKEVYALLLSMISVGGQREFWVWRWSSRLQDFLLVPT